MSYYPEPDSHIVKDKVKVALDLLNYATKKETEYATRLIYLIRLLKKVFALKAEFDKLGTNKFVNVSTSLNNLKTKVDVLDVRKLKTGPVDLKK